VLDVAGHVCMFLLSLGNSACKATLLIMSIQALELELENAQTLCARYAALIKSLEADQCAGVVLSMKDEAALIGYRFQLKQQVYNCEFIAKRIASGDDDSLVMGSDQALTKQCESTDQAPSGGMTVEESNSYLASRGDDTLIGIGFDRIQAMQQGGRL